LCKYTTKSTVCKSRGNKNEIFFEKIFIENQSNTKNFENISQKHFVVSKKAAIFALAIEKNNC